MLPAVVERVAHELAALLQHLPHLLETPPHHLHALLLPQGLAEDVHVALQLTQHAEVLRKDLGTDVDALLVQRGLTGLRLLQAQRQLQLLAPHHRRWLFPQGGRLGALRGSFLLGLFPSLLPAAVEEGEGRVEAVALAGRDEVVDVELVGVLAARAGVQVQLSELHLAVDRKGVLQAVSGPVDGRDLGEEVLHFVHREEALVLLELPRKCAVESAGDPLLGGEVLVEHEGHRPVEVAVLHLVEHSQVLVQLRKKPRALVLLGEVEADLEQFFCGLLVDVGGAFLLDAVEGGEFAVYGEEEVLRVVVEAVVEAVGVVEERLVAHDLHQLAEQLGPLPVPAVVLQRDHELQQLHLRQPPDPVLLQEVEDHELVEQHPVADAARHQLALQPVPLREDVRHHLLRVLPGQHLPRLVVLRHVLQEGQQRRRQRPRLVRVLGLAEVLVRLRALLELQLVDEVGLRRGADVDSGGVGLGEGQQFGGGVGEDGAGLGEQFALVDLGAGGDLGALGHGLDEFAHVGEGVAGGALLVLHAAEQEGERLDGGVDLVAALLVLLRLARLELGEVGADLLHVALQQLVDVAHLAVDQLQLGVGHVQLHALQLAQVLQLVHALAPPLLLLLQPAVHPQQLGDLVLLLLEHPVAALAQLHDHRPQDLHALRPAVLQQRRQLRLVQPQVLQVLEEVVVRRLQPLHQPHHVLGDVQREVLDVDVEQRHAPQLGLHGRGELLELGLGAEGAALARRRSALRRLMAQLHNKIIAAEEWTHLSPSSTRRWHWNSSTCFPCKTRSPISRRWPSSTNCTPSASTRFGKCRRWSTSSTSRARPSLTTSGRSWSPTQSQQSWANARSRSRSTRSTSRASSTSRSGTGWCSTSTRERPSSRRSTGSSCQRCTTSGSRRPGRATRPAQGSTSGTSC